MIKLIIFKGNEVVRAATLDIDERRIEGETDEQVITREAAALTAGPWIAKAPEDCPQEHPQFWIVDFETGEIMVDVVALLQDEAAQNKAEASAECRHRIYAVASAETQMNIATVAAVIGGKALGDRSDDESAVLTASGMATMWVASMRARKAELADDAAADIKADANWPDCPPEVLALAARF